MGSQGDASFELFGGGASWTRMGSPRSATLKEVGWAGLGFLGRRDGGHLAEAKEVRITCTHDCPDACSALVSVDSSGRAVDIKADASHPITGRHLCVKVDRYLERVYSPDRVLYPLRRVGPKGSGEFEQITWDEALDEITTRWQDLIEGSGAEAILGYSYLGSMGLLDAFGTSRAFFDRLGATKLGRSICGPQWFAVSGLTQWPWHDPENLPQASTVVVWGMDPVSTSIHTWEQIRKARKQNGAKLVVVDPYTSRTAKYADLHLRPHPGTDGALALGVAHIIFRDGLQDDEYIESNTTDVEVYRQAVEPWTPERVSAETGVPVEDIEEFALLYATSRPAAIRIGVGMQRSTGSGSALRAIQCLPALTGQWQWAAGGIHQSVSIGQVNATKISRPDFADEGTREVSMIQLGKALTELDPAIRSMYVWNSNPAVIAANQNLVLEGLARDDLFTVVHDLFLTDTAKYADIVLPATSMIEHADIVGSWGFSYLSWNEAAIKPVGESKSNSEVARLLAARMGIDDELFTLSDRELMELAMSDSPAEAAGIGAVELREEGFVRVGAPVGKAVAADMAFAFSCEALAEAGLHPVAEYRPPARVPSGTGRGLLRLLTLKRHQSINSSYTNLGVYTTPEPKALAEIHPVDAAARFILDGDSVRVYNELGSVGYVASITDKTPEGTISIPFGRPGIGTNALTSDQLGDIAGGPTFCDNLVDVCRS